MRFYCSDDTVDLEQYPYHVRDEGTTCVFIVVMTQLIWNSILTM